MNKILSNILKDVGISEKDTKTVKHTKDILSRTPNYVTVKVVRDVEAEIDGRSMKFKKGDSLVMPLPFYIQSRRDRDGILVFKPHKHKFSEGFRRYTGQSLDGKNLLISRAGGIGDIMFTQPICKYLKEKYPTCKIVFACNPQYLSLFESWPEGLIDSYVPLPFYKQLMDKADYMLSFEGSIEKNEESRTVDAFKIFSTIAGLNIDHDDPRYSTTLCKSNDIQTELLKYLPTNYIMIQMRTEQHRRLDVDRWIDIINGLIEKTNYTIVFADTPKTVNVYDALIARTVDPSRCYNVCSICNNLPTLINIIATSKGTISIDSSFTHLAPALGIPSVGIYGPFISTLRNKYYKKCIGFDSDKTTCTQYPCFRHASDTMVCPNIAIDPECGTPLCFDSINIDDVVKSAIELFDSK